MRRRLIGALVVCCGLVACGGDRTKTSDTRVETIADTRVETVADTRIETVEDTRVETVDDTRVETVADTRVETVEDTRVETIEDTADVSPPSSITLEELLAALAAGHCAGLYDCPQYQPPSFGASGESVLLGRSDCPTRAATLFADDLDVLRRRVASGALVFDGVAAARCVDAVGCGSFPLDPLLVCADALAGPVARGGACQADDDCAGDAHCAFGEAVCPGVCSASAALGEGCAHDRDCAHAAGQVVICSGYGDDDGVCRAALIDAGASVGGACGVSVVGDAVHFTGCAPGSWCPAATHQCTALVAAGGACDDTSECALGLACSFTTGTCEPISVATTAGAACGLGLGGEVVCDPLVHLRCDGTPPTCVTNDDPTTLAELGAPCHDDADCTTGVCDTFDADPGTCAVSACDPY